MEKCIKKCGRKAGATPSLCFPCLKQIATAWFMFNANVDARPNLHIPEIRDYYAKSYINKLQKRIRAAAKKNGND